MHQRKFISANDKVVALWKIKSARYLILKKGRSRLFVKLIQQGSKFFN